MQKITTYLTFAERGEEAVNFYVSLFPNSGINNIVRYGDGGPFPAGSLLNASFALDGQEFMAMDAGSHFHFAEGISLMVDCKTQEAISTIMPFKLRHYPVMKPPYWNNKAPKHPAPPLR